MPAFGGAGTPRGYLPLRAMSVRGKITGLLHSTKVEQSFFNSYDTPLEVTYIFPLPSRAAVVSYTMKIGKRTLRGKLQERRKARECYEQALEKGQTASVAEQERPDVFTVRVGNLAPGESLSVELQMEGPLALEGLQACFRFPLVVSERYIPGQLCSGPQSGVGNCPDTVIVPDASRLSPPVLLPGMPNPIELHVEFEIDPAGLVLSGVESTLHQVEISRSEQGGYHLLGPAERLNRDFVLRLSLDGSKLRSSLWVHPDPDGASFLLAVVPPADSEPRSGRDVVILLDRSWSMRGWSLVAARNTAAMVIESLLPEDRFAIVSFAFAQETELFRPTLLVADDANKAAAKDYLRTVEVRYGTETFQAFLLATQHYLQEPDREQTMILLTDGEVGDHDRLVAWAREYHEVCLHVLGIGEAANHGLLERLASQSSGVYLSVENGLPDRLGPALTQLRHAVTGPVLREVQLQPGPIFGASPEHWDVFPGLPALFHGRLKALPSETVELVASLPDGREHRETLLPILTDASAVHRAWARAHLLDLEDRWASYPVGIADLAITLESDKTLSGRLGRGASRGGDWSRDWMERAHDFWKRKGWPMVGLALTAPVLPIVLALEGTSKMAYGPPAEFCMDESSQEEREEERTRLQSLARSFEARARDRGVLLAPRGSLPLHRFCLRGRESQGSPGPLAPSRATGRVALLG
ncbi:MAG: VIT and VWA domain-containing protein [Vulcanimicrobiota bacterium]